MTVKKVRANFYDKTEKERAIIHGTAGNGAQGSGRG